MSTKKAPVTNTTTYYYCRFNGNCHAAGMDKFLTKPINVAHLHQVLQEIRLQKNR